LAALPPPDNFEPEESNLMSILTSLWKDEQGQDLIEYTLLIAFVALCSAVLFIGAGSSIQGIWSSTNSQLVAANASAASN